MNTDTRLHPLSAHSDHLPWPTHEWPEDDLENHLPANAKQRFSELVGQAFEKNPNPSLGETHAFLVIKNGQLIAEKYAVGFTVAHTYPSWSKAKSITQALVGIAVRDGKLDIHDQIPVPEWDKPSDPRRALTWDHLLRMSSGLEWVEEYEQDKPSDVIEMLYSGDYSDYGAYAANKPLSHDIDTQFLYSSGTSNIIARALSDVLGLRGDAFRDFMFDELFSPIGIRSAQPKFDKSGVFVGSSFCFCTARDFARFGYLYLRDGIWNEKRILPEGWVDYTRTPTPVPETETFGYGSHFWLGMCSPASFSANGFQGQYTIMVPETDLIIVRNGVSDDDGKKERVQEWLRDIAACFEH